MDNLFASPLFYIVLIVLIVSLAFRKEIGGLISRAKSVSSKVSKDGIETEIKTSSSDEVPVPAPPPSPTQAKVELQGVTVKRGSDIGNIEGSAKLQDVELDEDSHIGNISGGR